MRTDAFDSKCSTTLNTFGLILLTMRTDVFDSKCSATFVCDLLVFRYWRCNFGKSFKFPPAAKTKKRSEYWFFHVHPSHLTQRLIGRLASFGFIFRGTAGCRKVTNSIQKPSNQTRTRSCILWKKQSYWPRRCKPSVIVSCCISRRVCLCTKHISLIGLV